VLFIAGESSLRLSENKGAVGKDDHRQTERRCARLSVRRVNGYPDSKFKNDALEDLKALGAEG
jgi:hypothetical protein